MIQVLLEHTETLGPGVHASALPRGGGLHMDLEGGIGVYLKEKSIVGRKNT